MYFKLLTHVPALNVLAHRIVWSAIFLAIVAAIRGGADGLRMSLRRRDVWLALTASTQLPPPTPAPCTTVMWGNTRKSHQPWRATGLPSSHTHGSSALRGNVCGVQRRPRSRTSAV